MATVRLLLRIAIVMGLVSLFFGAPCSAADCSRSWSNPTDKDVRQTPVSHIYTRSDAPDIRIEIHQDPTAPALTDAQWKQLTNLLDQLPVAHLRLLHLIAFMSPAYFDNAPGYKGTSGHAFNDGGIMLNAAMLTVDPNLLDWGLVRHEIGHEVQSNLSDSARSQWDKLHQGSQIPYDVFSDYSLKDACEDFAETYHFFSQDSEANLKVAIRNAAQGHSKELDKMLFVASQFITPDTATADYDGTIEFFHDPAFVSGSPTDTGVTTISRVPYKKTSNLFQMDGYAFSLSGSNITQIADADGNVLASNISIPLVPPYWPVVNAIAAAPSNPSPTPAPPSTPPNPPPRNPKLPSPEISVGAEDNPAGSPEVVFGGGPGNYLPLTQGTVNSELRNLQVNGIRPGGITGTAVHGGVVVRQRGTSQPTSDGPTIRDNSGGGPGVITLP